MTVQTSVVDLASFQDLRPRLFGIAFRVLGNAAEADDVVQDAWVRWQRTDRTEVRDTAAFLAATTTRLAINVIQSAHARHETAIELPIREAAHPEADPSQELERREALRLGIRMLLARLSPAERAAYVLREAFDYPHAQVARVLSLSETNVRQLVVRARRRLTGGNGRAVGGSEEQRFLAAFVAAAQAGALEPLERILAEDCRRNGQHDRPRHASAGGPSGVPLAA